MAQSIPLSLAEGSGKQKLIQRSPSVSEGPIEYEYEYRDAEYEYDKMPEQRNEPKSSKALTLLIRPNPFGLGYSRRSHAEGDP